MKKIKVVWVCEFSNSQVREHLKFAKWTPLAVYRRLKGKEGYYDFDVWNTNAIREFEEFNDIELHVIAPHLGILGIQHFAINGVNYHVFHSENDTIIERIKGRLLNCLKVGYPKNTKIIGYLIEQIKPDIVHYIGAENPHYSESALSLPKGIPMIVSLQTLMCDPDFKRNYPISQASYDYRSNIEIAVIKRADYVATKVEHFRAIIRQQIKENVQFLDMILAVGEKVNVTSTIDKQYDFVYFAADISKAVDFAIEAFAIAKRKHSGISLHVIGGYDETLMNEIKLQLERLGLTEGVDFTGKLPTYDDVIFEIRKARFALLPLKIDLISGTIRESMANGLPVVTTITPATPHLNVKRECVLLSEKGDFEAMATNMCKLLENEKFVEQLRANAILTVQEMYDNRAAMLKWKENYYNIISSGRK